MFSCCILHFSDTRQTFVQLTIALSCKFTYRWSRTCRTISKSNLLTRCFLYHNSRLCEVHNMRLLTQVTRFAHPHFLPLQNRFPQLSRRLLRFREFDKFREIALTINRSLNKFSLFLQTWQSQYSVHGISNGNAHARKYCFQP